MLKKGAHGAAYGLKGAGQIGVNAYKQAIFVGRDLLGKLGVVIKFKPWQVVNMAKFATKAIPIVGAAIDVILNIAENITMAERNRKFEKNKDEVKDAINEVFIDCFDQLNDDSWFLDNFAPGVKVLEDQISEDENTISQMEEMKNKFVKWSQQVKSVELI